MSESVYAASSSIRSIDERLKALQLALPAPPPPAGSYSALVVRNGLGFVSGQFPIRAGSLVHRGRVGKELTVEEGRFAAEIAALNALAQIRSRFDGFRGFAGLLRLEGYVASAPGFVAQPRVLDAASELLVTLLGPELGEHARTAFAVEQLPLDAPVELCISFAVAGVQPATG